MKRVAAILLLGIFSFNLFGYQLVASLLEKQSDQKLELALDQRDYNDEELITIKQPTNLPYYQNSKDFQRIDGEIEVAGVFYKYVKCRIYNDSLELLCIPNGSKMKIREAKDQFAKMAGDQQQNAAKKKSADNKSFQKSLSDFEPVAVVAIGQKVVPVSTSFQNRNTGFTPQFFLLSPTQPPDVA